MAMIAMSFHLMLHRIVVISLDPLPVIFGTPFLKSSLKIPRLPKYSLQGFEEP
jgi:hypothetical protein